MRNRKVLIAPLSTSCLPEDPYEISVLIAEQRLIANDHFGRPITIQVGHLNIVILSSPNQMFTPVTVFQPQDATIGNQDNIVGAVAINVRNLKICPDCQ